MVTRIRTIELRHDLSLHQPHPDCTFCALLAVVEAANALVTERENGNPFSLVPFSLVALEVLSHALERFDFSGGFGDEAELDYAEMLA